MALSINWSTRVIFIPQADLTDLGGGTFELDLDVFRLALKDLEDDPAGMAYPDTHRHETESVLSGVTYARKVEIVNGYTVEFEDGQYQVSCVGANHNLADVKVLNQVSLIVNNSAGHTVLSAPALTAAESAALLEIHRVYGLDAANPVLHRKSPAEIVFGASKLTLETDAQGNVTVSRES